MESHIELSASKLHLLADTKTIEDIEPSASTSDEVLDASISVDLHLFHSKELDCPLCISPFDMNLFQSKETDSTMMCGQTAFDLSIFHSKETDWTS